MGPKKRQAPKASEDNDSMASSLNENKKKEKTTTKRGKKQLDDQNVEPDSASTKELKRKGAARNTRASAKRSKNEDEDQQPKNDTDSKGDLSDQNIPSPEEVKPKGRTRNRKATNIKQDGKLVTEKKLKNSISNNDVKKEDNDSAIPKKSRKGIRVKQEKGEDDSQDNKEGKIKSVIINGKAPVDSYCDKKIGKAHVYVEDDEIWDCMLNQFNNNKYYVIQLLEDNDMKFYSVWFRWGRVGNKGQNSLVDCGTNLERAKMLFMKKFADKTKNSWDDRESFEKVPGKYDLLKMDYSTKKNTDNDETDNKIKKELIKIPDSKLDKRIQELVELICDVKKMEDTVVEMKYDATKAPLGRLTTGQIKAGYKALKDIEDLVTENVKGKQLVDACNNFYTRIPHNFGMRTPPLITTRDEIRKKLQLLEILGDIEVAMTLIKEATAMLENPIDNNYKCLQCTLNPIPKESELFKKINDYLQNTHEKNHNLYKMELMEVFDCCKEGEKDKFNDVGNRMLLWHGSRLTNWAGILKRGLQIAPPEAPVTGYMFGKGVYFADRSSKSANYCYATRTNNIGLLLLCEVALGNCNELLQSNYNGNKLPNGKHSVKGVGMITPNPSDDVKMDDGTVIPLGKGCNAKDKAYDLNFNEYVIYNTNQIKMRYLIKVKFHFIK